MHIPKEVAGVIFGLILLYLIITSEGALTEGTYRIENVSDGLHLTTEGGNSSFAHVVTENWQNFAEQKWEVKQFGRNNGYQLMPLKYTTNNPLSYYKDPSKKYPLPENWILVPIRDGYQIQNYRTSGCLISGGRRKDVPEQKCDKHVRIQLWKFHSL